MRALLVALLLAFTVGCTPASQGPEIVAFTATWCKPCQRDKPLLKEVQQEFSVSEIDLDTNKSTAERLQIYRVPTYIVYDEDGTEYGRTGDLRTAIKWLRWLNQLRHQFD